MPVSYKNNLNMNSYKLTLDSKFTLNLEYVSNLIGLGFKELGTIPIFKYIEFELNFIGTEEFLEKDVRELDLGEWLSAAFGNVILIDKTDPEAPQGVPTIAAEHRTLPYVGKLIMNLLNAKLNTMGNATSLVTIGFVQRA